MGYKSIDLKAREIFKSRNAKIVCFEDHIYVEFTHHDENNMTVTYSTTVNKDGTFMCSCQYYLMHPPSDYLRLWGDNPIKIFPECKHVYAVKLMPQYRKMIDPNYEVSIEDNIVHAYLPDKIGSSEKISISFDKFFNRIKHDKKNISDLL